MKGLDPFYNARLLDAKRSIERALVQDQPDAYFYDCVSRAITFLTEIKETEPHKDSPEKEMVKDFGCPVWTGTEEMRAYCPMRHYF